MHKPSSDNSIEQIEDTLRKGEPSALSLSERADIKRALFLHIDPPIKQTSVSSLFAGFFPRLAIGTAFACCALILTGVVAEQSLPGDTLYGVKLQMIDPVAMAFEVPDADIVGRHIWRLERRLDEARILEAEATLTDESAAVLIREVTESARAVESEIDAGVHANASTALVSIDRAAALLDAHDELLTSHDLTNLLDGISLDVDDARNDAVEDILHNNASTSVSDYINRSLHDIASSIEHDGLSTTTIDAIEINIKEVSETLQTADYAETVEHISEANQRILVEEYLRVAEDEEEVE